MKYFFDTEFNEEGISIDLISVGITDEQNRQYYAVSREFDPDKCNPWVKHNVIPKLFEGTTPGDALKSRSEIAADLKRFVAPFPEFWAYYGAYDWVAVCQLFGGQIKLPQGWPGFIYDLKVLLNMTSSYNKTPPPALEHHSLHDAIWVRENYNGAMIERAQRQLWLPRHRKSTAE